MKISLLAISFILVFSLEAQGQVQNFSEPLIKSFHHYGTEPFSSLFASLNYISNDNVGLNSLAYNIVRNPSICNDLQRAPGRTYGGGATEPYKAGSEIPNGVLIGAILASAYSGESQIPKSGMFILYGLLAITSIPGATASLYDTHIPGNRRVISGVVSASAGVALVPIQTSNTPTTLRWMVVVLWASTYGAFLSLTCRYLMRRRKSDGPIYLFCALLLALHFVFGFAKAAETTEEATKGLFMFGPLATTLCAVLVFIPIRYRPVNAVRDPERSNATRNDEPGPTLNHDNDNRDNNRDGLEVTADTPASNASRPAADRHDDESGDVGLARLVHAVVGMAI